MLRVCLARYLIVTPLPPTFQTRSTKGRRRRAMGNGGGGGRSGTGRTGGFTIGGPGMGSGLGSGTMVRARGGLAEPYTATTAATSRAPDRAPTGATCLPPARRTSRTPASLSEVPDRAPSAGRREYVVLLPAHGAAPPSVGTPTASDLTLHKPELAGCEDARPLDPGLSTLHLHANVPVPRHLRPHSRM